jgi:Mlc titration factor MtfA (ptsG expression regulator)
MLFSWWKSRRRRKVIERPFPDEWVGLLARNFPHWALLDEQEQLRLQHLVQVLLDEKSWTGCGGLAMTDEIRLRVAAQAALLILSIPHDYYDNVESILVYPSSYMLPRARAVGPRLLAEEKLAVQGSAHHGGPVVLSWDSARSGGRNAHDGHNLVYHEFAHKLDMLDGVVDGTPELESMRELHAWVQVMTAEFERLQKDAKRGKKTLLDKYGATNPGEFFAVATEVFFEKPVQLRTRHAELYEVLRDFYQQDLAARMAPKS